MATTVTSYGSSSVAVSGDKPYVSLRDLDSIDLLKALGDEQEDDEDYLFRQFQGMKQQQANRPQSVHAIKNADHGINDYGSLTVHQLSDHERRASNGDEQSCDGVTYLYEVDEESKQEAEWSVPSFRLPVERAPRRTSRRLSVESIWANFDEENMSRSTRTIMNQIR